MNMIARQVTSKGAQAAALALVFGLLTIAQASAQSKRSSNIAIKNFGQMDDRFFRGAQPEEEDYKALAELGVKTIIDLRDDPKEYAKSAAEAAGLRYINIQMSDSKYPKDSQIEEFLKIANNATSGKLFVHCAGGRHRTGVMGAVYRYNFYNWNYDQVYKEMKDFDYYSRWGHGALKDYVRDYFQRIQAGQIHTMAGAATGVSN